MLDFVTASHIRDVRGELDFDVRLVDMQSQNMPLNLSDIPRSTANPEFQATIDAQISEMPNITTEVQTIKNEFEANIAPYSNWLLNEAIYLTNTPSYNFVFAGRNGDFLTFQLQNSITHLPDGYNKKTFPSAAYNNITNGQSNYLEIGIGKRRLSAGGPALPVTVFVSYENPTQWTETVAQRVSVYNQALDKYNDLILELSNLGNNILMFQPQLSKSEAHISKIYHNLWKANKKNSTTVSEAIKDLEKALKQHEKSIADEFAKAI
jgi:hypothetical protein